MQLPVHRFTNAASGDSGEALFARLTRKQCSDEDSGVPFQFRFAPTHARISPTSPKLQWLHVCRAAPIHGLDPNSQVPSGSASYN